MVIFIKSYTKSWCFISFFGNTKKVPWLDFFGKYCNRRAARNFSEQGKFRGIRALHETSPRNFTSPSLFKYNVTGLIIYNLIHEHALQYWNTTVTSIIIKETFLVEFVFAELLFAFLLPIHKIKFSKNLQRSLNYKHKFQMFYEGYRSENNYNIISFFTLPLLFLLLFTVKDKIFCIRFSGLGKIHNIWYNHNSWAVIYVMLPKQHQ